MSYSFYITPRICASDINEIIFQVACFPNWFNIIYDKDPAVYKYHQLDKELESEDLKLVE